MRNSQPRYYTPPTQAAITTRKNLIDLSPEESITYVEHLMTRLTSKQQREKAYLDRRAARGTHTPTDDAYEADQQLESELLALLDDLLQAAKEATGA